MNTGRFADWQRRQGWKTAPLYVRRIVKNPEAVTLEYYGDGAPDERERLGELERELAAAWGTAVRFVKHSPDWAALVSECIASTQPALAALLGAGDVVVASGEMVVTWPSSVAESLFRKWGGIARVKRDVPAIADLDVRVVIRETPPPLPDAPVSVDVRGSDGSDARIGSPPAVDQVKPMDELPSGGSVVVRGRVFARDVREGRDKSRHWTWSISDERGALRLRYSERRSGPRLGPDVWPPGTEVVAHGVLEPDKYTGELGLKLKGGLAVEPSPLIASGERPRIELHAHTKMSAMDGLMSPKDLFGAARDGNIRAVAVTDHGVVQAYPEADAWSRSTGVQAVYGVEAYMVDTEGHCLGGPVDALWRTRPLVVLDVETTGLTPRSHQVIELGAVKIVAGQIVESFHRLVKPSRSVSETTTRITGISATELADGIDEESLWNEFFAFADGAVLAAHNARFDMGFVRRGQTLVRPHENYDPVVLDTLGLARIVAPGLKSYGLGPLTQHYKIPLSQHHRALADAEATGLLALRLLAELDQLYPNQSLWDALPVSHTVGRPVPVTLLLRGADGLNVFYRLISQSHLTYFHRVPRVPRAMIEDGRAYWLVGSPFHDGEISDALFRNASPGERRVLEAFYDYWEVVPPSSAASLAGEEHLDGASGVESLIRDLVAWGRESGKLVAAVSDAHYVSPHQKIYRDILAATAKGELHHHQDLLSLRSWQEMDEELGFLSDADRRWVIDDAPQTILDQIAPLQPVPNGLFSPHLAEAETVISEAPYRRAVELYGSPLPLVVQERLDRETQSIVSHGFSSIYYIAHRLVLKSLEDGYLVGSRGSVGSSLVATLLNITEVNPLPPHYRCPACRYSEFVADDQVGSGFDLPPRDCPQCGSGLVGDGQDIPFETFLGFEGDKVPDIDLNFSGEYQPEIHRYTEELFGKGHVFRAGTIATVADKTAFGLVKAWARETGRDPSPVVVEWLASSLTGVKRTTGQHPGGLMVVPEDQDIHSFSPVQHPADDRDSDVVTTHFDYHSIEGRLLKLDLLGHDDPTAIRMLEDLTGVSASQVPFHDEKTMSLFSGVAALGVTPEMVGTPVGSLGIPEFGTRFVRQMLVDTRPRTFSELVRISGLSHGTEVWANNAQDLIRQGVATLSQVIATRDDIMSYLLGRKIAPKTAFAISEAVRKGRGLTRDMEAVMRDHAVPDWYIESCHHITYLFPKAHAAAYVMMGWRIAWFKVHHPLAYYATYFSVRAGDFDAETAVGGIKQVNHTLSLIEDKGQEASPKEKGLVTVLELVREMLARGFDFHPIDLQRSHATRFLIDDKRLIIPFAALPGLGVNAARHIIQARDEMPFLSIDDLRQRGRVSKGIVELLRQHGALSGLGETSQLGFF